MVGGNHILNCLAPLITSPPTFHSTAPNKESTLPNDWSAPNNRDMHQHIMRDILILIIFIVSGMVISIVWCSIMIKRINLKQEENVEEEPLSEVEYYWMEAQGRTLINLRLFHPTKYLEESCQWSCASAFLSATGQKPL